MENIDRINQKTPKEIFYPERASSGFDELFEKLRALEEGKLETLKLSEYEKEELLKFENELGEKLDGIYDIKVNTRTFYTDYLLTDEGQCQFKEQTGISLANATRETIAELLLKNRDRIGKIDVSKIEGNSEKHAEKILFEALQERVNSYGQLDIDGITTPERVSFIANPQEAFEKISSLRKFKTRLKELNQQIGAAGAKTDLDLAKAKRKIIHGFGLRVNEMIADQYPYALKIKQIVQKIGFGNISEDERKLFESFKGLTKQDVNLERLDKFVYGESREVIDSSGRKKRISQEILNFADKIEAEFADNEIGKDKILHERGLDPRKIFKKNIPPEVFTKIAESVVAHYGELSSYPPSDYSTDRAGPAPDGKWQVIAHPKFKAMSVNFKQHVIKSDMNPKSIFDTITTLCGHEIEGHFVQNLNKKLASTRLLKKAGSDRKEIFSEAAAMMVENEVAQQVFGLRSLPWVHYVRAMQRKLEGGNYLDSLKAFFESGAKISKRKKEAGLLENDQYDNEIKEMLGLAINQTKRLFRGADSLSQSSQQLRSSKDTVYLEQLLLAEKLKKAGMEKYLFFSGGNINTLLSYAEMGLVNLQDIKQPKYFSTKVWEIVKHKYLLEKTA